MGGEHGRVHRLAWDGASLHELARYPTLGPVRALTWHPGRGLVVGLADGRIQELRTGRVWQAHAGPVTALVALSLAAESAAAPATACLLSGGEDGRVLHWDLPQGPEATPLATPREARPDFITRLRACRGGALVAGYDGRVTRVAGIAG